MHLEKYAKVWGIGTFPLRTYERMIVNELLKSENVLWNYSYSYYYYYLNFFNAFLHEMKESDKKKRHSAL